jgi:nicotinamidase-related amidase
MKKHDDCALIAWFEEVWMKPALLVVDVQKTFFKINPETEESLKVAIRIINAAVALFRERHLPIICIQHMNSERQLVPGESDFEVSELLNLLPSDVHIHKTYANSFNKTRLSANCDNSVWTP